MGATPPRAAKVLLTTRYGPRRQREKRDSTAEPTLRSDFHGVVFTELSTRAPRLSGRLPFRSDRPRRHNVTRSSSVVLRLRVDECLGACTRPKPSTISPPSSA